MSILYTWKVEEVSYVSGTANIDQVVAFKDMKNIQI